MDAAPELNNCSEGFWSPEPRAQTPCSKPCERRRIGIQHWPSALRCARAFTSNGLRDILHGRGAQAKALIAGWPPRRIHLARSCQLVAADMLVGYRNGLAPRLEPSCAVQNIPNRESYFVSPMLQLEACKEMVRVTGYLAEDPPRGCFPVLRFPRPPNTAGLLDGGSLDTRTVDAPGPLM